MGSGLVSLTTAFYLSKDPANQIKLLSVDKGLPYNPKAQLDGPMISGNFAAPMTNKPVRDLLKSTYHVNSPNFLKMSDILFLPGALRFLRFWLNPWAQTKTEQTD